MFRFLSVFVLNFCLVVNISATTHIEKTSARSCFRAADQTAPPR